MKESFVVRNRSRDTKVIVRNTDVLLRRVLSVSL